jgi:hypothetical protein
MIEQILYFVLGVSVTFNVICFMACYSFIKERDELRAKLKGLPEMPIL